MWSTIFVTTVDHHKTSVNLGNLPPPPFKKKKNPPRFFGRRRPSVLRIFENLPSRESCNTESCDTVAGSSVAGFSRRIHTDYKLAVTGCRVPQGHSAGGGYSLKRRVIYMYTKNKRTRAHAPGPAARERRECSPSPGERAVPPTRDGREAAPSSAVLHFRLWEPANATTLEQYI